MEIKVGDRVKAIFQITSSLDAGMQWDTPVEGVVTSVEELKWPFGGVEATRKFVFAAWEHEQLAGQRRGKQITHVQKIYP